MSEEAKLMLILFLYSGTCMLVGLVAFAKGKENIYKIAVSLSIIGYAALLAFSFIL